MNDILNSLKISGNRASFVIGGAPDNPVDGKVLEVSTDKVIIETTHNGMTYRYAMHPTHAVIIERV